MKIQIKYFSKAIDKLILPNKSANWIDLRAAEEVSLKAGEMKLIRLGVGMILPEGYEAHIVARSSTFKNFGVLQANAYGVVDETYCGEEDEWCFPAYAVRDTVIHVNDRICQFRIEEHQPTFEFEETEHLKDKSRGGFGTSGIS